MTHNRPKVDRRMRQARLELDEYTCQLSKLFGIAHLSKQPCSNELEVHHVTYVRAGYERIDDLITVCSRCHPILTDGIRSARYKQRVEGEELPKDVQSPIPIRTIERSTTYGQPIEISDSRRSSSGDAQRGVGRSTERDRATDEEDFG